MTHTDDDEIIIAYRNGRAIYWGYLSIASERFGFDPQEVIDRLDRDGNAPCLSRDPLNDHGYDHGERVVYVIKRAES